MASVKIKLRESKIENKEGKLFVQIIHNRQIKTIPTPIKVKKAEWDEEKQQIIPDLRNWKRTLQLNEMQKSLDATTNNIWQIIGKLSTKGGCSASDIVERHLGQAPQKSLQNYMKRKTSELQKLGRYSTARHYACTLRQFTKYHKNGDIPLDNLTAKDLKNFEQHLTGKGVSMNTISFYMRNLRSVYNKAVKEGIAPLADPFADVYTGTPQTVKRAIDEKNIARLHNLKIDGHLAFARDIFLFSFYTRGMAFVDMAHLTTQNLQDRAITYKRSKTGQNIRIGLETCMTEIIKRYSKVNQSNYLLPILSWQGQGIRYETALRTQNQRLKTISTLLQLPVPITTYVSRHSWATIARKKGIALSVISEGMGHTSERTTRIYLDALDHRTLDRANRKVIKIE